MNELDDTQVEALKDELLRLRQELRELLRGTKDGSRPVDLDEPIGRLTRMDAIQQQSMSAATRRAADLRLRQVEQALRLLDEGRYGACLRCEEPIGHARLRVRPESPFCLDCQEEIDSKHG